MVEITSNSQTLITPTELTEVNNLKILSPFLQDCPNDAAGPVIHPTPTMSHIHTREMPNENQLLFHSFTLVKKFAKTL